MSRALELAVRGQGCVEPNPMVGCVIVRGDEIIGEGWHQKFGGPHAEIEAMRSATSTIEGATMFVTLEPCCHSGKTPPCTVAIIAEKVSRVVAAQRDPFSMVDGAGIQQLQSAGIAVEVGLLAREAMDLNAPYRKLLRTGRPWIIAKWAMTLDGKLATADGDSQWISNEASRAIVHQLRGRVDGVMVGIGTARRDDPMVTARPAGPRIATRIIVDSHAALSDESRLVQSAMDAPVLLVVGSHADRRRLERLTRAGCSVFETGENDPQRRLGALLDELGRRNMTNVLVEGGGRLLGSLFDMQAVDEVHVFIAPKIIAGERAVTIGGNGIPRIADALSLDSPTIKQVGDNVYVAGRVIRGEMPHA